MDLAAFGWEADRLHKNTVQCTVQTPPRPIRVLGYQLTLAMIPSDPPLLSSLRSSQVLFECRIDGVNHGDDWGKSILYDHTGDKQNLHGGGPGVGNVLVSAILKASPWTSAVNDVLAMSGLAIDVPAKSTIVTWAAHAGQGPVDFEVQGVIFYE